MCYSFLGSRQCSFIGTVAANLRLRLRLLCNHDRVNRRVVCTAWGECQVLRGYVCVYTTIKLQRKGIQNVGIVLYDSLV
jgi:hypothetical protein